MYILTSTVYIYIYIEREREREREREIVQKHGTAVMFVSANSAYAELYILDERRCLWMGHSEGDPKRDV